MAFTMSLDDFVISYFVYGPRFVTLPVEIYNYTKKPLQPKIYALFTLLFAAILIVMVLMNLLQERDAKPARAENRRAFRRGKKVGSMKRIVPLLLCAIMIFTMLPVQAKADDVTINVYNWGQYIADGTDGYIDVNKAFTEKTGIKVNYMTFDSNETMYTKLKTGGSTYDVIIPSDYMIARLIAEDMLEELDYSNIPNYALVDEAYKNTSYDPENKYSVPYTWGTVGVIYNKKYVSESDIGSWDLLWNEKYSGKILMFDNPRDAFAIAELLLGIDINSEDQDELRSATYKLIEQKPLVQGYVMDQIFSKMEREEAWIAPYYAGDYLLWQQENPDLAFYFPKEGFNLFIDAACIPKGCQNKAAAEAYNNFLCDPEISGRKP